MAANGIIAYWKGQSSAAHNDNLQNTWGIQFQIHHFFWQKLQRVQKMTRNESITVGMKLGQSSDLTCSS